MCMSSTDLRLRNGHIEADMSTGPDTKHRSASAHGTVMHEPCQRMYAGPDPNPLPDSVLGRTCQTMSPRHLDLLPGPGRISAYSCPCPEQLHTEVFALAEVDEDHAEGRRGSWRRSDVGRRSAGERLQLHIVALDVEVHHVGLVQCLRRKRKRIDVAIFL